MTKTTRFEWFEKGYGTEAVQLGIIIPDMFTKYIRYKIYLEAKSKGLSHDDAVKLTMDRNRCSYTTVWRDIKFFEDESYSRSLE